MVWWVQVVELTSVGAFAPDSPHSNTKDEVNSPH